MRRQAYGVVLVALAICLTLSAFNIRFANAKEPVCDINDDGIIDLKDVFAVSMALGSCPGHAKWNTRADVNGDDCVNLLDVYTVASHFGDTTEQEIAACVRVYPHCLSLRSRGRWVTCIIGLREGYDVHDIDVSTVLLNLVVPANQKHAFFENCDGVSRLIVKFDRQAVIENILKPSVFKERFGTATLTVTGELTDGTPFKGSCWIRTIG